LPTLGRAPASKVLEEVVMNVIVYGDFNCPYSYLASQRAGRLRAAGVAVDWRAVEHDRRRPASGLPSGSDQASWSRELAEVASLALPGEQVPAGPPALISNTEAAVAAYAEAVSDGIADELRGSLFRAIWAQGLNLSSPHEVRRLVTDLMWPREDVAVRLASPDFPSLLLRDTDMTRIVRRPGGTIALNGVPLTTAGWQRVRQWRQEWLALPSQVIPAVIGADQIVRPGVEGLRYLAGLAGTAGEPARAGRNRTRPERPAGAGRQGGLIRPPAATWQSPALL
jgi:2-hydroxychromene-2-carboxylate isomerase